MKVVLITGASRGIGKAAALESAKRGFGVIATYNSHRQGADEVVAEIEALGGRAAAMPLDVADIAGLPSFVADVAKKLQSHWGQGGLHGLVNNAGIGSFKPMDAVSESDFDAMMNVHLKGPFFLTQALLPVFDDGASIVNVTSATTRVATVGVAPYASMKGGLEVLTRYMAKEFGERRIRANAVSPGAIRTDLGGGIDNFPELERLLASQTSLGRIGEGADVGRVIATLLSDESGWINAQSIEVAGGYNI